MKRETAEVVEAARGLQIKLAPKPSNPKNVRIAGEKATFPDRLHRVAVALVALDKAGSRSLEPEGEDDFDVARLKMSLDGVFRWMRSAGIDVSEPHAVVSAALGGRARKQKAYKPVPPTPWMPKGSGRAPGPLLSLAPGPGETITMAKIRERALRMRMVEMNMGAAAPR